MAKYGYFLYGLKLYGEVEPNRTYYNANLTAWNNDYGVVEVDWTSFTPDPADPPPTHWRLVRSFAGIPDDPYIGEYLDGDVYAEYRLNYVDRNPSLNSELMVYYSLWSFNGAQWIRVGQDLTPLARNTGTDTIILRWLPAAWLNQTEGTGDATGNPEPTNTLVRWLSGYIFAYDRLRAEVELISKLMDYRRIPAPLLEKAVTQLDLTFEPSLGDFYHRSLYRSGHVINSTKGSHRSVKNYATALTHWGASTQPGTNLLLNYNDSSFENGLGNWSTTNSLVAKKYSTSFQELGTALTSPQAPMRNTQFPPKEDGFGLATYPSSGSWAAHLGTYDTKSVGTSKSIPVTPNETYTFSGYFRALTGGATVGLQIHWMDIHNRLLESQTPTTGTITTAWKRFSTAGTAPAKAAFACFSVTITGGTSGHKFALDQFQFSKTSEADRFQDARSTVITMSGQRTNFLLNCNFEAGLTGWSALNGELAQSFSRPGAAWGYGAASAKFTVTANGKAAFISTWIPINPGAPYTFSMYVTNAAGAARTAIARLEFTQPQARSDQNRVITDTSDSYFVTATSYADSAEYVLSPISTGSSSRMSVYTISPSFTRDSGSALAKVSIYFPNAQAGDVFYFDGGLLEESAVVNAYFQGNGAPTPAMPHIDTFISPNDCSWEMGYQTNFIPNPSFDSTTDWTATGATLTSVLTGTGGVDAFAGNNMGRVAATGTTSSIATTAYHSKDIYGGESVSVSFRVYGRAGTYTLTAGGESVTQKVATADANYWTTISLTRRAAKGETSFAVSLSCTSSTAGANTWYVDGAQAEYSNFATWFVDVASNGTTTVTNPKAPTKNIYLAYAPLRFTGRSFYWANYENKMLRLVSTLDKITPLHASWQVQAGDPTPQEPNIPGSLLLSSSFEATLRGWTGVNATISRGVSKGTHYTDYAAHGASWGTVVRTGATGEYGLTAEDVYINPGKGYYLAAAIKPADSNSGGTYTVTIDWLDENKTLVRSTSGSKVLTNPAVWNYIALTDTAAITISAVAMFARVSVTCTPTNNTGTKTFYIDRVLFRE